MDILKTDSKHIFLIDDDHATNVYNEIILNDSDLPATFSFFNSAEKVLQELKNTDTLPDFLLLDINMPRMDGWEFLEQFVAIIEGRKPPHIVMLTTSLSSFDNQKSKDNPLVTCIMEKPLSVEIVEKLLQEYD